MKNICLIPARGGSKRIPKKNIKKFHGQPLIYWSIKAAKSSDLFDDIYVSTDDLEIASIAEKYGAKVPFIRPKEISNDYAKDKAVREHFLQWMSSNNLKVDILCYLYATAPFINKKILLGCKNLLLESKSYLAHTVTTFQYPVLRALEQNEKGELSYKWPKYSDYRSQDLPELLHDAGQCYFFNLNKNDKERKRVGYRISRIYANDIDTLEDFEVAERLFEAILNNPKNK
tara:strand:+ start:303 stop:992 length:690 start_codon:yes stop_codon:yes gene_type:complete